MSTLQEYLKRSVDSAEPPKPLPVGTYRCIVKKFTFIESKQKKTPGVEFALAPQQPLADVDQMLLSDVKDWQNEELRWTGYFTDKSLFMIRQFIEACGVPAQGDFDTSIPQCVGRVVDCHIVHGQSDRGTIYSNIDGVAPAQ